MATRASGIPSSGVFIEDHDEQIAPVPRAAIVKDNSDMTSPHDAITDRISAQFFDPSRSLSDDEIRSLVHDAT